MKIVSIVGARPQFVKAAAMSRAIAGRDGVSEILVHTGQHFDADMSQIFFDELGIAPPRVNLGIHGGGHGEMTGRMLAALEQIIVEEQMVRVEVALPWLFAMLAGSVKQQVEQQGRLMLGHQP